MNNFSRKQIARHFADKIKAGSSIDHVADELALYLVKKKQQRSYHLYIEEVIKMLHESGQQIITVTTAHEMSVDNRKKLEEYLAKQTSSKTMKNSVEYVIDNTIIGGLHIKMPHKTIDETVKKKLELLKKENA